MRPRVRVEPRSSYILSRRLFLRALGVVFFIAFVSFWVQAKGLIGANGIWPMGEGLSWVHEHLRAQHPTAEGLGTFRVALDAFLTVPTLFWVSSGDGALQAVCGLGTVLSVFLALGFAPRWVTLGLWALYLSVVSVGHVFMGYQWDLLLLETGLLGVFLAPGGLLPFRGADRGPSWPALWLLRWLLFRLMFMSGMVKVLSHDPTWRDLTALDYHYWTQPLPGPISWYAAQGSQAFHKLSCAVMFAIELVSPFLIFGPRRVRHVGAAALVALQVLILATGNYGFFNWLTIVLCVLLVDDEGLRALLPTSLRLRLSDGGAPPPASQKRPSARRWGLVAVAALLFVLGSAEMVRRLVRPRDGSPELIEAILQDLAPFRSVNSYGLFAVMTTQRPEIQVEGSSDGQTWKPYVFKWKPGPLDRIPGCVAPHQPRLDWQMWFAALQSCRVNPWFLRFQQKLLEGAPEVLRLLADNPFPGSPPRFMRSMLAQYRPATSEERRRGLWWERGEATPYCPPLTLRDGHLERME